MNKITNHVALYEESGVQDLRRKFETLGSFYGNPVPEASAISDYYFMRKTSLDTVLES